MLKKFAEGLIFGAGFAISFFFIPHSAAYFLSSMFTSSQIEKSASKKIPEQHAPDAASSPLTHNAAPKPSTPFHELDLDAQIKEASVIALAKHKPSTDGNIKMVITEFLKNDPSATIYYNVGDEYESGLRASVEGSTYGDGVVMFFIGSPATMKKSMTYSGNRIRGLGDLPIELLRQKCKEQT